MTVKKSTPCSSRKKAVSSLAAGAAALYAGSTAEAEIIHIDTMPFTSDNSTLGPHLWDVDGNSTNDFNFSNYASTYAYKGAGGVLKTNRLVHRGNDLANLPGGFSVGPTIAGPYSTRRGIPSVFYNGSLNNVYGFTSGDSGFIGFRFDRNGDLHYGWAAVTLTNGGNFGTFEISEWAWENTPDTAIMVGATGSSSTAVPEPTSFTLTGLTLLAMGAAGVRRWRKEKADGKPTDDA